MNWKWWSTYILNIDTISAIVIAIVVIYFIITAEKKKYKFDLSKPWIHSDRKRPVKLKKTKKLNKGEEEARRIFQELFGVPFKSVRPNWLKNPVTGKNLELDGFNPNIQTPEGMGLAMEFDGEQHAKYTPHFHRSGPDEFEYQVKKDSYKDMKCKEKGVILIRIPHNVAFTDMERYIRVVLKRKGVEIPIRGLFNKTRDDPSEVYQSFTGGSNIYG